MAYWQDGFVREILLKKSGLFLAAIGINGLTLIMLLANLTNTK